MPRDVASPGASRGLLGVRKDPSLQFFPFGPHSQSYSSDDSSDSDYDPGEGTSGQGEEIGGCSAGRKSTPKTPSKKTKKSVTPKKRRLTQDSGGNSKKKPKKSDTPEINVGQQAVKKKKSLGANEKDEKRCLWSQIIPDEVLLRIFSYAVDDEGAIPLLFRLSEVCRKWHRVSSDVSLWRYVDLSAYAEKGKDSILDSLVKTRLSRLEKICLDGWKKLTVTGVKSLVNGCPHLKSISLSGCDKLYLNTTELIANKCHNLTSIDLSYIQSDAANNTNIHYLLTRRAHQLKELHLRKCRLIGSVTLRNVMLMCNNLVELDLSGTSIPALHVEKLQAGCPKLQRLHLASLTIRITAASRKAKEASNGFPDLEFLSICSFGGGVGLDDDFLLRLLKTSVNLKVLDMRGCSKITRKGLLGIPCVSLEKLYISRSMPFLGTIETIVQKWGSCLKTLKMARNSFPFNLADLAMDYIAKAEVLEVLDLESTSVSSKGVRVVLEGCKNLKELNLTSCRGIARGIKRLHNDEEIEHLRRNIDSLTSLTET